MARLNAIPWRAALEMRRGRGPLALSWLETARPEVEKLGEFQHMRDFYPVLAECLRQGGRREDALQAIDHVVAVWRPLAPLPGAVPMLGEAVGVYASLGKTEVADELARALQASVERLPTARNQAWLSEALGVLALARGESASAEAYLSKAGEGWRSMGMAYFGARNYFRQAQAGLAGKRDLTAVRTHLRSAREILERLRAQADLAALAEVEREAGTDSKATPELLTPREQEVMTLLAQGMTNREIARQLVISVKTAEIHVSNILAKLGLTSRAQVAARVAQEGLAAEPTGWAAQADRPRPGSRVT
jgi:DNA-binding CsgD family transcriptional regulator